MSDDVGPNHDAAQRFMNVCRLISADIDIISLNCPYLLHCIIGNVTYLNSNAV